MGAGACTSRVERWGMVPGEDLDALRIDASPEPPADGGVAEDVPPGGLTFRGLPRWIQHAPSEVLGQICRAFRPCEHVGVVALES